MEAKIVRKRMMASQCAARISLRRASAVYKIDSKQERADRQSRGSTTSPSGPSTCMVFRHQQWQLASSTSSISWGGPCAKKSFLLCKWMQKGLSSSFSPGWEERAAGAPPESDLASGIVLASVKLAFELAGESLDQALVKRCIARTTRPLTSGTL
jgi:hypothetical protein